MEVKILLCLHFATFKTSYLTFIAFYLGNKHLTFLKNHYLSIIKFHISLSKAVKRYLLLSHNVPLKLSYKIQ
jgi:hypothetical protein